VEPSANLAVTGYHEIAAVSVCDPIIRGFIARRAVASRGVAAPARELFRGSLEVTPHHQVKQHKVYDRPRKK